jgi:hypothetical protein
LHYTRQENNIAKTLVLINNYTSGVYIGPLAQYKHHKESNKHRWCTCEHRLVFAGKERYYKWHIKNVGILFFLVNSEQKMISSCDQIEQAPWLCKVDGINPNG